MVWYKKRNIVQRTLCFHNVANMNNSDQTKVIPLVAICSIRKAIISFVKTNKQPGRDVGTNNWGSERLVVKDENNSGGFLQDSLLGHLLFPLFHLLHVSSINILFADPKMMR